MPHLQCVEKSNLFLPWRICSSYWWIVFTPRMFHKFTRNVAKVKLNAGFDKIFLLTSRLQRQRISIIYKQASVTYDVTLQSMMSRQRVTLWRNIVRMQSHIAEKTWLRHTSVLRQCMTHTITRWLGLWSKTC